MHTFLPPYSPDLQPIEFGWKDVNRELSGILEFDSRISGQVHHDEPVQRKEDELHIILDKEVH